MNLPSNVLTALKASLQNTAHQWVMSAVMEHTHTEEEGAPPDSFVALSKTFQLRSEVLGLILPITADFKDGALQIIRVFFQGTSFDTTDAPLLALLNGMAGPAATAAADALLAKLTPA